MIAAVVTMLAMLILPSSSPPTTPLSSRGRLRPLGSIGTSASVRVVERSGVEGRIVTVPAPHATLRLEIANTEAEREHGLMDRTSLAPHTGMLFVFDTDDVVTFWMKNTLVPLDMVFVSAGGRVRSVASNVPVVPITTPDDAIPRRTGRAKYVIELPAGEAAKDGIIAGVMLCNIRA